MHACGFVLRKGSELMRPTTKAGLVEIVAMGGQNVMKRVGGVARLEAYGVVRAVGGIRRDDRIHLTASIAIKGLTPRV
jgi:hypothetical protein